MIITEPETRKMDEMRAKVLELQLLRFAMRQNVVGGSGIRKYFQFNSD